MAGHPRLAPNIADLTTALNPATEATTITATAARNPSDSDELHFVLPVEDRPCVLSNYARQ